LPHARHAERVVPLIVNLDEVSSTEVRARIKDGRPWRHLLPSAIAELAATVYT